jgi:hypothetical protein
LSSIQQALKNKRENVSFVSEIAPLSIVAFLRPKKTFGLALLVPSFYATFKQEKEAVNQDNTATSVHQLPLYSSDHTCVVEQKRYITVDSRRSHCRPCC